MNVRNRKINMTVIFKAITEKGWSHYRLANEAGISHPSISRIFKTGTCSRWHLHLIAKALGIEEETILEEENK